MNDQEIEAYTSEIIVGYVRDGDDLSGWEMYRNADEDVPLSEEDARRVHGLIESEWHVSWPSDNTVTVTLPEPESIITDADTVSGWNGNQLIGDFIEVWDDGLNGHEGFTEAKDVSVDEVQRAGVVLLAVAAKMRTMKAWGGSDAG